MLGSRIGGLHSDSRILLMENPNKKFSFLFQLINLEEIGKIDDSGKFLVHYINHKEKRPAFSVLRNYDSGRKNF